MSAPIVKSRRQHLRLWFEFYKLCHRAPVVADHAYALAEEVYKTAIDKADAEYISCLLAK